MTDTCLPLVALVIRHPVVIPPSDEFDHTYKLKTKKYPETIEMLCDYFRGLFIKSVTSHLAKKKIN